ncbi:guanine nucleotide-like protein [Lasius niger]|uniref:Guanine nucleotide-like protein n=1 Tax=Lasius niger TaxID=67767 RepID=A0A0J7K2W4_LASNI|nr:guanine nucleotide-like protein [Lasius niger]
MRRSNIKGGTQAGSERIKLFGNVMNRSRSVLLATGTTRKEGDSLKNGTPNDPNKCRPYVRQAVHETATDETRPSSQGGNVGTGTVCTRIL